MAKPLTLTPKQQRFVEEYLVDLNASDAARRAGYSKRGDTAKQAGFRNLRKPLIQAALAKAQAARAVRTELSQDYVVQELQRIVDECDPSEAKATRALELLGKHLGMFTQSIRFDGDRVEIKLSFDPTPPDGD